MQNNIEIYNLFDYGLTYIANDWEVKAIYPQFHRVYYLYSGEAMYESPDEKIVLEPNILYLLPAFEEYSIHYDYAHPFEHLWFHFNLNNSIMSHKVIKTAVDSQSFEFYSIRLLEKCVQENSNDMYSMKSALNLLLSRVQVTEHVDFVSDQRINKVLKYIHDNYGLKLTNKTLANLINTDHRHFIRLFKKDCNQTPHEYIANYRLLLATHFLQNDYQVNEVARMVGFEDPKAFSRFFKAHKGIPPSEFKHFVSTRDYS